MRAVLAVLVVIGLAGCGTFGGPYPSNIGGKVVKNPPVANFRGRPVIQVTFVVNADSSAEAAFLDDYTGNPLGYNYASDEGSELSSGIAASGPMADRTTAETNMKGMFAKNAYYAFHLAKFLRIKSDGDLAIILNPVTLKFSPADGYSFDPFEKNPPPYDVEINFMSYVHPNTKPSTKGGVLTTYGESIAPIVSIRMDPKFNPAVGGAVAMTNGLEPFAQNVDGKGLRAQFIDYLNAVKYNESQNRKLASEKIVDNAKSSGPFETGKYFRLALKTFDLSTKPIPKEIIPPQDLVGRDYAPGNYRAYEFYNAYYKVIVSALNAIDNNKEVTQAQKTYWASYEPGDLSSVMLERTDRRKRWFLTRAKHTEIQYLEDRDTNWMKAVLSGNEFARNFNALREAEQNARGEYIAAQWRAAAGVLVALGGAYVSARSSRSNSSLGTVAGITALAIGIQMVTQAITELSRIDVAFTTSFSSAYASQKSYIFETADGERIEVRGKDYRDFKNQLKKRYQALFPTAAPAS